MSKAMCPDCNGTGDAAHEPPGPWLDADQCEQCNGTGDRPMSKASAAIKRLFAAEDNPSVRSYRTPANDRSGAHRLHIGWRDSKQDYAGVIVIRDEIWAFEGLRDSPHGQRTRSVDGDDTYRDMLMSACTFGGERDGAPESIRDEIFCIRGCAYFPAGPNAGEEPEGPESDARPSAAALIPVTRKTPFFGVDAGEERFEDRPRFSTEKDVEVWFSDCIRGDYDGDQVFQDVTDAEAVWFVWCSLEDGAYTETTEALFFRWLLENGVADPGLFGLRP